jgi:hypothetical protein
MFEDEILKQFLAKAVEDAKKEIKDTGSLAIKNAIPLLLHSQYNHILHLEEKMATKDDLQELEGRLTSKICGLESMIKSNRYWMIYGFTFLALVFTLLSIFLK